MGIVERRVIGSKVRLRMLVVGILSSCAAAAGGPPLPTPCAPAVCGPTGASQFVTSGSASAVAGKNTLTINQGSSTAILNWSSFNIASGNTVTFKQPSSSAVALNRIFQSSPSQIFGAMNANGQIYLLNLNGFLFGPTASINVGSLLVSSLPLTLSDANFSKGILSPLQSNEPVFDATQDPLAPGVGRAYVLDIDGNPVLGSNGQTIPVQVVIQPGAQISAADQGRLLFVGQNVTNGGSLSAPDGQVILAAGSQVFLQASDDPTLRGLVVEVNADDNNTAWNQISGNISTPRGNVTLVGLAVNQDGRISATTSVAANGSIRLEAAQGATTAVANNQITVASSQGGSLTIGPESQMQILPETASTATAVSAQTQYQSSITLLGEQVIIQGGSIDAPNGVLTAIAAANPSSVATNGASSLNDGNANARLHIDSGTSIDLAGSTATVPVTQNLVAAQLRSSELADDPTQRNGPLHGATVYVDARDPPPASLADVSAEIANIAEGVAQRTETGGTATFESEGDIVLAKGASLNVSGGYTNYTGAVMQTSYLIGANGQLYPIATANPLQSYVGVLNPTFTQTYNTWGVQTVQPTPGLSSYQPGYLQGAAAGSVQFAAPNMVLQGSLLGSAVNGLYQRTPATAVPGATLVIGVPGGLAASQTQILTDYLAPGVRIVATPTPVVVADDASLPGPSTLELPASYLTGSGFSTTDIFSNYDVTLPAGLPLALPAGSTLSIEAARINLNSSISSPGGSLTFESLSSLGSQPSGADRSGIYVGNDVTFDVDGLYTNDFTNLSVAATSATWQNGGSIALETTGIGNLLSLGSGDAFKANGGAWISSKKSITAGQGGAITIDEDAQNGGFDAGSGLSVAAFGVDGATGGTFALTAPRIEVVGPGPSWLAAQQVDDTVAPGGVLEVGSGLFSDYGFQNITLGASGLVAPHAANTDVLTIAPGTGVNALVATLELPADADLLGSAPNVANIASIMLLPSYLRSPATVNLIALPPASGSNGAPLGSTNAGDIFVGAGASISTDAGGSINLTGLDSIVVNGGLYAPGGSVTLHVETPTDAYETGFVAGQRIELGSAGVIDVAGTLIANPSSAGLDLGTVYAGGSVSLLADRGAVDLDPGSLISVMGVAGGLDVQQPNGIYSYEVAASAGGSIQVHSGEAISLLGNIEAAAGSGGTSGTAAAGSLDVVLSRAESWWGINGASAEATFNQSPLTLELEPTVPSTTPPSPSDANQALLGATQLQQWGIDALRLESSNVLEFSGAFSLALNRQIVMDAPVLLANTQAQANLSAPYLELGFEPTSAAQNTNLPSAGNGVLSFSGGEIDLVGQVVMQDTSRVTLSSSGDLLLRGEAIGTGSDTLIGGLTLDGALTLDAARIYPVTATSFAISADENPATGVPGTVTIGQTSADPGTPLSAGGALAIDAYSISSTGTLYAPFGSITLNATNGLTLGNGSLTSVSGAGLIIPYGATEYGGEQWLYGAFSGDQTVTGIPTRAVNLSGASVSIAKTATVDLSGGGDLLAYEWVPGPGGSTDALAPYAPATSQSAQTGVPGLYAVVPWTRGEAASQDPSYADSSIAAGETVYLSGGGGLAAGIYPLLPARYALLPGAYLIEVEPSYQSATTGVLGKLVNGTPVVAGFLSYGLTGLHQAPGYEGFAVYPGSYGSELAGYDLSLASSFFSSAASEAGTAQPPLPADAGALSISVLNALDIAGQVRTAPGAGGLVASIAISANDLVVGNATGPLPADAVEISAGVLSSWQPGALLLGGTLVSAGSTSTAGGSQDAATINVAANTVTIGSGGALTADQITLVADQSIDVQAGAVLQASSAVSGKSPATAPVAQAVTLGSGNPALLAVSDLNWLEPVRSSTTTGGGTVTIAAGATVASRGSLTIDGTGGVSVEGSLKGAGAEWSLGSASIALVPAGVQDDTLAIGPALLAALQTAGAVRLASQSSIDIMAPVSLGMSADGTPSLNGLTLIASSLNDTAGSAVELGAKTVTLQGQTGAAAVPAVAGSGALTIEAGALDIGSSSAAGNALTLNGFGSTLLSASAGVVGEGSTVLGIGGAVAFDTAGLTAAAGANTSIEATGAVTVNPAGARSSLPTYYGGALSLSGTSLTVSGTLSTPGGLLALSATDGNVSLEPGAVVSAAGALVPIGNQLADVPGGSVSITASGDVSLGSQVSVNVAGAGTAAAGALTIVAGGTAGIDPAARLSGGGSTGGSFVLDAGALASTSAAANPLDALASTLTAGGFTGAIDLRTHTGNLALDAGSTLTANTVTLTADSGEVIIAGSLSAPSAATRGDLSIFGGAGVELLAGSVLSANGSGASGNGASGRGGTIEIGAGQLVTDATGTLNAYNAATIALDAGSTVSAAGAAGDGTLILRAPALVASGDIGITSLAANTAGVGTLIIEPVLPFNTGVNAANATPNSVAFSSATAPTAADFQNVYNVVSSYLSTAVTQIASRLSSPSHTPMLIEAGVEIVAPGALTLQSSDGVSPALDLSSWQFAGAPVDLTIRAAGGLTVLNNIQDGFVSMQVGSSQQTVLLPNVLSSSIRLVAGADLSSANPLAVVSAAPGLDLTIGSPTQTAVVRTGTGTIDLAAADDVIIGGAGSGAYTAGNPALDASTLNLPKQLGTGTPYGILIGGADLMSFPANGGDLLVSAGNDVVGVALPADAVPSWQLREGGTTYQPAGAPAALAVPPEWGVNLDAYNWNFGTLGGGDLKINAGGSISNVSAAAADSLLPNQGGNLEYVASGGLSIQSGGDVGSAQIFLADGTGNVRAGGGLTAILPAQNPTDPNVGSFFYLQSSTLNVSARTGIAMDGVFNPTALSQISAAGNSPPAAASGSFFSYGATSALDLESVSGDVVLGAADSAPQTVLGSALAGSVQGSVGLDVFPASLGITAVNGNIDFGPGIADGRPITLYPLARGELDLLAAENIENAEITMSDAVAGTYPTVATPLGGAGGNSSVETQPFAGDLHSGDPNPALITAGVSILETTLSIPKAATIVAGLDVSDLSYSGQNLASTDQTLIMAGRDVVYSDTYSGLGVSVGGPGSVEILAGRNITLGFAGGVVTTGNILNPNLPTSQGADLTMVTGLGSEDAGAEFTSFLAKIVDPSTAYQGQLETYTESLTGNSYPSFTAAQAAFEALPTSEQRTFIDNVFFDELGNSGIADNTVPGAGFTQGYAAIAALFPGSMDPASGTTPYAGDLTLDFSRIYTLSGGNLSLIVPGGLINVGLANPPPYLAARPPSSLGIVTEETGNIDIYALGDVNVNASRIFTLGGGNILIWSNEGSIDAGLGAKTAVSAPPPTILIASNGTITLNYAGAATGSGIRTIQTDPTTPEGNVELVAPVGTVNAGDAGIGAAGDIDIAARSVVGVNNISFGGTATGVPAQVSSIGASLSGATSAGSASSNAASSSVESNAENNATAASLAQTALSWLDVFVTGLGEENCKQDDIECLKRQKTAAH